MLWTNSGDVLCECGCEPYDDHSCACMANALCHRDIPVVISPFDKMCERNLKESHLNMCSIHQACWQLHRSNRGVKRRVEKERERQTVAISVRDADSMWCGPWKKRSQSSICRATCSETVWVTLGHQMQAATASVQNKTANTGKSDSCMHGTLARCTTIMQAQAC
eukprot:364100-Chlamydomonas_euryale.AAC.60